MLSLPIVHLLDDWSTLSLSVVVRIMSCLQKRASKIIVLSHYADMSVGMISLALNLARCRHAQYPGFLKELMTSLEVSNLYNGRGSREY